MDKTDSTMAQQIAQAAMTFEERRTGHRPQSATVVLSEDTVVIALYEALSPAEKALTKSPEEAAQVQEFHRQLFSKSSEPLRQEIKKITGVHVVVHAFTTGTMVQVFLLAGDVPSEAWSRSTSS